MTLKEEIEILRGEPIKVFDGNPMDIPCIETSDPEKLCKNPVVSVHMITYNHEPYIRQAIEGVMMQKTDFEFELVIGEDCSQDKTREICFEYQKEYPDKIRVLWWHENVSKFGGNYRRVTARCRGEYVAICEGDDYWTDSFKLQKQVDVLRQNPNVGLCFTDGKVIFDHGGESFFWHEKHEIQGGLINGRDFCKWHAFGDEKRERFPPLTINTASVMYRAKVEMTAVNSFDIFKWNLSLSDSVLWLGLAAKSDVWYLDEATMCYRQNNQGAMQTRGVKVIRDAQLIRCYYSFVVLNMCLSEMPVWFLDALMHYYMIGQVSKKRSERNLNVRML